jgi:hypothetical protein
MGRTNVPFTGVLEPGRVWVVMTQRGSQLQLEIA